MTLPTTYPPAAPTMSAPPTQATTSQTGTPSSTRATGGHLAACLHAASDAAIFSTTSRPASSTQVRVSSDGHARKDGVWRGVVETAALVGGTVSWE